MPEGWEWVRSYMPEGCYCCVRKKGGFEPSMGQAGPYVALPPSLPAHSSKCLSPPLPHLLPLQRLGVGQAELHEAQEQKAPSVIISWQSYVATRPLLLGHYVFDTELRV